MEASKKRVIVTREDIINAALTPMMRAASVGEGMRFRAMVEALADTLMENQVVPEWATHFTSYLQYVPRHGAYKIEQWKELKR